jgi:hypothetical protein
VKVSRAHQRELADFATAKAFRTKGPLCVALVVTQHAKTMGLPLDAENLLTERGGQVFGLGKGAVQAILKRHSITRVLAAEGGRTSRGSLDNMREYVTFVNGLHAQGVVDLNAVEAFWIERVNEFFAAKPFKIKLDASLSLRTAVGDVIAQAMKRQKTSSGVNYAGAVLQHLTGAKLDRALGRGVVVHNSSSTADAPRARAGDFLIGDVAIHVTTSPSEAVIEKCRENLNDSYRPMLVTLRDGVGVAEGLAANAGIGDRIDIFEIEQFVALNLYELGKFEADGRKSAVTEMVERYNEIVEEFETDPSLRIELRR